MASTLFRSLQLTVQNYTASSKHFTFRENFHHNLTEQRAACYSSSHTRQCVPSRLHDNSNGWLLYSANLSFKKTQCSSTHHLPKYTHRHHLHTHTHTHTHAHTNTHTHTHTHTHTPTHTHTQTPPPTHTPWSA